MRDFFDCVRSRRPPVANPDVMFDDQHAIAYLLFNGDVFDVEAITVNRTRAGGGVDQHLAEAQRVVRLCGLESEIPVLLGADQSFEEIRKIMPGKGPKISPPVTGRHGGQFSTFDESS